MNPPARPASSRRWRPWLIALAVLLIGVPLAGYAALLAVLNSDAVRPRVEAAVQAATGRGFTLSGPVGLKASLVPAITLDGPVLANAPGGSRPDMLRARRIEAEVALLPLLSRRIEVRRVTLVGADLLLEMDASGRGNWQFVRPARPEAAPSPTLAPPPQQPFALDVEAVAIEAGRVTWRGPAGEEVIEVPRLLLRGSAQDILGEGQVMARGVTVTLNGGTGPLAALLGGAGAAEWPFRLGLSAPGLNAEATGALALPFQGAWHARVAATADQASRLAPALPGVALPDARGLSLVAEAGSGTGLRALHVSVAEATLGAGGRALIAGPLQLTAASPEAPVTLGGGLRSGGLALNFGAQGPTLAALRAGGAMPVAITLDGEGVSGNLQGTLAPGWTAAGTDWSFALRVPDLRALALRAGAAGMPALHEAALDGRARLLADGVDVTTLTVAAREASGRASIGWRAGAVPHALLRVVLERLDADAMRAADAPAAAPVVPPAAVPSPADGPTPAPASPTTAQTTAPSATRPDGRVIPDRPVDVSALRDAAISLDAEGSVAVLRAGGADWRDVSLRAVLDGRKLEGERFSAVTPGGPVSGRFSVAADGAVPRLSLTLRSGEGGVDPGPLMQALGLSALVSGPAALDLALAGEGAGTRALAASLTGHLGLAMTGGRIDPRLLAGATAALRGVVPGEALGGAAEIRCLALRFDLAAGVAQSRALLVETRVASTSGAGAANLGDETLAFRLRPVVRVGDLSVTTPLGVTGRFGAPRFSVDANAAAAAAAGVLGGLGRRSDDREAQALGALAEGLLGGRGGAPATPDCATQLAVARGEAPAAGVPPPAPAPRPAREPRVQDLLRGLLGR